jgi:branched-chain amino acid transport system permease protein
MTTFLETNKRYFTAAAGILVLLLLLLWLGPIILEQRPARMIQSTITGLLVGGVYALIALGIVVINKASGVFNFAHGWMMLLGGLVFYSFFSSAGASLLAAGALALLTVVMALSMAGWRALREPRNLLIGLVTTVVLTILMALPGQEWQYVRALVGAVTGAVLAGLAIERLTIRPLIGQPLFAMVLMTLAVSQLLHGVTQLTWGSVELPLQVFAWIGDLGLPQPIRFDVRETLGGIIIIRTELLFAFALALVAFAAFVLFFQFTNVGLSMRGAAEDQRLAQALGLRVRVVLAVAWAIAALLAMTAGVLQGGATSLSLNMPLLALLAFPAVLLGGLESIGGALAGGLIIGLVQEWANLLFPGTQAGTELAPYVVLMAVLVVRPDGLFGQKRIERI